MARLFLAVWPDDDVVDELRLLPRKDRSGVRFVPPERWHVTVRFLGEADPHEVAAAVDLLDLEALPAATARYGPAVDLLTERHLVVPVQGLDPLEAEVRRGTRHLGEPPPRRRYQAHLTLARTRPGAEAPPALGLPITASHPVEELALVESRLHPDGPTYRTLATWPVGVR